MTERAEWGGRGQLGDLWDPPGADSDAGVGGEQSGELDIGREESLLEEYHRLTATVLPSEWEQGEGGWQGCFLGLVSKVQGFPQVIVVVGPKSYDVRMPHLTCLCAAGERGDGSFQASKLSAELRRHMAAWDSRTELALKAKLIAMEGSGRGEGT